MIVKPKIRLRKEWGALAPDPGMFRYPDDIRQVYYRATLHHGTDVVDDPRAVVKILRAYQIHHMEQGWNDLSYHYALDRWGRIWAGRDIHYRGCHAGGANTGNLGVVFLFDGRREKLTQEAVESAVALLTWWCSYLRIDPKQVFGHRHWGGTECPGDMIAPQVDIIRQDVTKNLRGA